MITIIKALVFAAAATMIFSLNAYALVGPGSGNGGDMCEDRIKTIRNDIGLWLSGGGSLSLKLPATTDQNQYKAKMQKAMQSAKISCIEQQVTVQGVQKTCRNFVDQAGSAEIICNIQRFSQTNESDQYILIHHEFAGLAGLEITDTDGSEYGISNQISGFLADQVTKKLVVKSGLQQLGLNQRLKDAIFQGDAAAIYRAAEDGADLNDPFAPSIFEVLRRDGATLVMDGPVSDDIRSGPIYSRDSKVSLIKYLVTKGANPNQVYQDVSSDDGETALFQAQDPVIMSALLDAGGDPKAQRYGKYDQPLLSLLFFYKDYPNKPYFRKVIERMLKMGASSNSCFSDNSACVWSFATDPDLADIFVKYKSIPTM